MLQRSFSAYPDRWPGAGLLLLRATVGTTVIIQGVVSLSGWSNQSRGARIVGLLVAACGVPLLAGFLTLLTVAIIGLGISAAALSWLPVPTPNILDSGLESFFVIIMAAAIGLLGPGAFSVDARLFGHRKIIIPQASYSPKP
jgi:hypothetical protein